MSGKEVPKKKGASKKGASKTGASKTGASKTGASKKGASKPKSKQKLKLKNKNKGKPRRMRAEAHAPAEDRAESAPPKSKPKSKSESKSRAPESKSRTARPDIPRARPHGPRPSRPRPEREDRQKRSLSNQGGETEVHGPREIVEPLRRALDATSADPDELTHGFHAYPAKMHPAVAYHLLETFQGTVLDPFCGSGTVLVEARVGGRVCAGVDLNPLALRVAEVKTDVRHGRHRKRFATALHEVAARSEERVRSRVDVRAPVPGHHISWYGPHVLKELAGLREEILDVENEADSRALEVVLSAIVVKFSQRRSESAPKPTPKRIRKGLVTEFFVRKGEELVDRWAKLEQAVRSEGGGGQPPILRFGDARDLPRVLPRNRQWDLVISSPPYGGTYDYVEHHELRYPWLGLDARELQEHEIGARRHLAHSDDAPTWEQQVHDFLTSIESVLSKDGVVVLLVGDAQIGQRRMNAAAQLVRIAPEAGLRVQGSASQTRPDRTGGRPREEHLVMLTR